MRRAFLTRFAGLIVVSVVIVSGCEDPLSVGHTDERPSNITTDSETRSVEVVWEALVELHEEQYPEYGFCLNEPASEEALRNVQREVGQTLPDDVQALYRLADGQSRGEGCLPLFGDGYWFLSLDEMASWWQMNLEAHQGEMGNAAMYGRQGAVYGYDWHPAWIPLASRERGDSLIIDFVPTPLGASGQIVRYQAEDEDRDHMAMSVTALLGALERDLEAGERTLKPDDE